MSKEKLFVKDIKTNEINEVELPQALMDVIDAEKSMEDNNLKPRSGEKKKEKNPRYWSNKYWKKNSVTDILNEIIEPNSVDVNDLHMKDELCPKIWDSEDQMNEEVRKVLLKNVIEFIKYCKVDKQDFKDVTVTGSLANYNYTETSDIDVHILMDFDQISEDKEFVGEYFKNKKNLWSEAYPATIKGHDVELYIQDTSESHTSTGVYSLITDKWLTKPVKKMIAIDTANVQLKAAHIMNAIDDLKDNYNHFDVINKVESLMDKIKKMRQSGLDKDGEFSTENIVFKVLRNSDYLKKLVDTKKDVMTKELTLEGEGDFLAEGNVLDSLRKYKNVGTLVLGMIVSAIAAGHSYDEIKQTGVSEEMILKAKEFINNGEEKISNFMNTNNVNIEAGNDEI